MGLTKTWTNNRIEPLSGDPLSGLHCINFLSSSEESALLAYRESGLLDIISVFGSGEEVWQQERKKSKIQLTTAILPVWATLPSYVYS